LIDIYLANLDITVRTQITYMASYRSFDVTYLGEYGFGYEEALSLYDTFTNISKMHPSPVSYDKGVHFNNTYSTVTEHAYGLSTTLRGTPYNSDIGDWHTDSTTWNLSSGNQIVNPIPMSNNVVEASDLSMSGSVLNEAGNMQTK